jgi:uncharacterized protein (DUF885 family)
MLRRLLALAFVISCAPPAAKSGPNLATPVSSTSSSASASASGLAPDPPEPAPRDPAVLLLGLVARFAPESLSNLGLPGHEEDILDLRPGLDERVDATLAEAVRTLRERAASETDPSRKLDLQIVLQAAENMAEEERITRSLFVPHQGVGRSVYNGLRANLRAPGSEAHAMARLKKYLGDGGPSIFALERQRRAERAGEAALLFPLRESVLDELRNLEVYLGDLKKLFAERNPPGHEAQLAQLEREMKAHAEHLRQEVLPRARSDFRLPLAYYDFLLRKNGVKIPRAELARQAREAYAATQKEMAALASRVARSRAIKPPTVAAVIERLKADQRSGDALLALYQKRLQDLDAVLRRERLLTLPEVPVRVRLATAGETANNPSPSIDAQALFRKDAPIDFILPVGALPREGERASDLAYTDFSFEAASWSIAAHEARPGHELQFSAIKQQGLSLSRTLFAFNSANVEGWGLYAEWLTAPFFPEEGKLATLRFRALREARAFLDPGLHEGTVTLDEARRVLREELGFSEGVIRQEIDRYTHDDPAQATTYFYGYRALRDLRAEVERGLGSRFDARSFHDTVLSVGLLPPHLQRAMVLERMKPGG